MAKSEVVNLKCSGCKKSFQRPLNQVFTDTPYCTVGCWRKYKKLTSVMKLAKIKCKRCGNEFSAYQTQSGSRMYCSFRCFKGTRNFDSVKNYKLIRDYAFSTYGAKCQLCGTTTKKLHVHHKDLTGHHRFINSNNNIDNLAILCEVCHVKAHTIRKQYLKVKHLFAI